jgi:hypothetical protein
MTNIKSLFTSRTVWANIVGLSCFLLSIVGIDTCGIDKGQITDTLLQGITGISFVLSIIWRITAKAQLKLFS